MAKKPSNETTSKRLGSIASKALKNPGSATKSEVRSLAGTALTQRPAKPKKSK